jgi:coenzyme F420 hydrogenase subunit beta
VCAYIDPQRIRMVEDGRSGRRPMVNGGATDAAHDPAALTVCPGVRLEHTYDRSDPDLIRELTAAWGPVYEVWAGQAADPKIRFAASSGGAASALALFCIEQLGFHGVLHIAARPDVPYLNHTVLSTTRAEILTRTGSRYAPASPCDGLQMIEDAPGPCVFIGKPCDVAAVQKARRLRPQLDRNIGLTVAFFCAGTPTTRATFALLARMGVTDPARVQSLRYRGRGWPGRCVVTFIDGAGRRTERSLSYEESWGLLAHDKQWRCHICPDHTGEFADIAVGDAWHRVPQPADAGRSLVLARTPHGREVLTAARAAGALHLAPAAPAVLWAARPGQLQARGALWGRLLALRLLRIPVPQYTGLPMFRLWLMHLSLSQKLRSVFGTVRRVVRKRLHRPLPVVPFEPDVSRPAPPQSAGRSQPQPAPL